MSVLEGKMSIEPIEKKEKTGTAYLKVPVVFVVDDDMTYRNPLVTHLEKYTKYEVHGFTNGEDCLSEMDLKPRAVILDYNLNPEWPNTMNGLDVLRQIKKLYPETYVIMLSGRDAYRDMTEALALGAYTYVLKDVEAVSSVKKILRALFKDKDEGEKISGNTTL